MTTHVRNTVGMLASQLCGARNRRGGACQAPAVKGKERCRMHGGGRGSGGQPGNQNALKHGAYAALAQLRRLMKRMEELEQTKNGTSGGRTKVSSKRNET